MYSGYRHVNSSFAYEAFTLFGGLSQNPSARIVESIMRSEPRNARIPVWPLSISLAATLEIDFSFSSSGYLDVSVHRVPFLTLWIGVRMTGVSPARFPHSEICGYNRYLLFPAAYRSLSRLSSALSAKASTLRSFLLDLFRFYSVRNLVCNKLHFFVWFTNILWLFSDVLIFITHTAYCSPVSSNNILAVDSRPIRLRICSKSQASLHLSHLLIWQCSLFIKISSV